MVHGDAWEFIVDFGLYMCGCSASNLILSGDRGMWLPDFDDVMDLHTALVDLFQNDEDPISPPGVKSEDLLHSACNRPLIAIGDQEKYKSINDKIAALFHSLVQNHPFHNGNKRTALVTLIAALYRNNLKLGPDVNDDSVYNFVCSIADGKGANSEEFGRDIDRIVLSISGWINANAVNRNIAPNDILISDFIKSCEQLGAISRRTGDGFYLIINRDRSVRVAGDIRKIAGRVARAYLKKLGLNEINTGVDIEDFQNLDPEERDQISRYIVALKRLAKT